MIKSVYIHIPFCTNICSYCDFCKVYKNDNWTEKYLESLDIEIKQNYKKEKIKTLYIGGGTPSSLNIKELEKLFNILNQIKLDKNPEITFEANVEDLTEEKLEFLQNKINRLSIGVQTFNKKHLKTLNRKINIQNIKNAKKYFKNINIDLMYNFKDQTLTELQEDINKILKLDIPHISAYSLILEPNTKLFIDNYQVQNDSDTFDKFINKTLTQNGYIHYEVSNYAKKGYEGKHNLTYWNNENYYGFGLNASGYIENIRYDNTKNLTKYLNQKYIYESHKLDLNETMQNEFILGLRKIKGINKQKFKAKYNIDIKKITIVKKLLETEELLENKQYVYINPKYIYISNEILVKFLENLYEDICL